MNFQNTTGNYAIAAGLAASAHTKQRRKDPDRTPYINHPLEVAVLLTYDGQVDDVDTLIAAVLHDVVEDTDITLGFIFTLFGPRVRDIVAEVTDDKSLPSATRKQLQIDNAPGKSDAAKMIKIADKIVNIQDMSTESPVGWSTDRKFEYIDWATKVVAGCAGVNSNLDAIFHSAAIQAKANCTTVGNHE